MTKLKQVQISDISKIGMSKIWITAVWGVRRNAYGGGETLKRTQNKLKITLNHDKDLKYQTLKSRGQILVTKYEFGGNFGMSLSWKGGHSKFGIFSHFWYEFEMSLLGMTSRILRELKPN